LEIWFGVVTKDHPPHDRVGKSRFSYGQHLKNHRLVTDNNFKSLPQPRRTHNTNVIGMVIGITLDTVEGTLQFSENGIYYDEPIFDERFKVAEYFPCVSFEKEGDQILFSQTLEWKGVEKFKSDEIEKVWDNMAERFQEKLEQ
jgi:hypothetical protein